MTHRQFHKTNALVIYLAIALFSLLGSFCIPQFSFIGPVLVVGTLILNYKNHDFSVFMYSRNTLKSFIRRDVRDKPFTYAILVSMTIFIINWAGLDYFEGRPIGSDVYIGLFCVYIVFCVLILYGYYKNYRKLPWI